MKELNLPDSLHQWSQPAHFGLTIRGYSTPDTGKPLVHFLHGNGMCGLTYWPMLEALQKDFDLIITDIQGHGDSDAGDHFLGWNTNAEICTRVLKHHLAQSNPRRPVYGVAHSLGGALTTLMAGEHPELFKKLVLLDPVYFPRGMITAMAGLHFAGLLEKFSPLSKQAKKRRTEWPTRVAAENYLRGRGIFKGWDEAALKSFVRYAMKDGGAGHVSLKCPTWLEAKIFGTYPKGLWKTIKSLKVSTDLIMAENTFSFSEGSAERAVRLNKNFSMLSMRGHHCFMQEYPLETTELVRDALLKRR